ncbi:hypothetical protein [Pseudohongiella sp.]|uniref:Uncharacterized protein n=1 Tax=marine sediment metagenome TaxID=412755 RepID=A0A0F9W2N9_9ZZZZ|nr:hypothetical protein [Pseudohongiella sp.]HDZ09842.1 hypothetical protein [Pseudohongiella sp.]HEA61544.1 hypothetical protein [Pseudohongiella sp.]
MEKDTGKAYAVFCSAGCFGGYPRRRMLSRMMLAQQTGDHSYIEPHESTQPLDKTVTRRPALETQRGLIYFTGDDPCMMRDLLKKQEELDFYV